MTATPSNILKIFIDTNIFVALKDNRDPTHKKAVRLLDLLEKRQIILYTSSDVLGETLTVAARKLGKKIAKDFLNAYKKSSIHEIFINERLHEQAQLLFYKTDSKQVSFIDCSSVCAMKEEKISVIFTFDKHFKLLGVKLLTDILQ